MYHPTRRLIARTFLPFIIMSLSIHPSGASAEEAQQTPPDEFADFQALVYEDGQGGALPYRLLVPQQVDKAMPVLLFLHGAGERGDDNQRQLIWGKDLLLKAAREFGCIVVAPQCPDGEKWSVVDWSQDKVTFSDEPSEPMRLTQALIDDLTTRYDVDTDRLYIMGLSMGGYGSWDAICRWPGRFTAAAPICGGGDPAMAERIVDTPVWAFHGDADPVVAVDLSRVMIQAIRDAGGDPKYTEYPGVGHGSWTPAFAEPELLPWLTAQSLAPTDEQE
jgi:predicted peptidase